MGSVSLFLRVSMAVWGLVEVVLDCFFDDYTLLPRMANKNSAATSAECLLELLGINFAKEGKKVVDWSTKVKTLGVVLGPAPKAEESINRRF